MDSNANAALDQKRATPRFRAIARARGGLSFVRLVAFAYGLGMFFRVSLVGQLFLSELLVAIGAMWSNILKYLSISRGFAWIAIGFALVLLFLIVSDVENNSEAGNFLRGWANIVFAFLNFVFLLNLFLKDIKSIDFTLMGLTFGALITYALNPTFDYNSNTFKVVYLPIIQPLSIFLALILYRFRRVNACITFVLAMAILFAAMGARSAGVVFAISGILIFLPKAKIRIRVSSLIPVGAILTATMYVVYYAYVDTTLKNSDNIHAVGQLTALDNPYNPIELLAQGRSETIVAMEAISERPVIGYGSWAPDPDGKFRIWQLEYLGRYEQIDNVELDSWIPSHSIFLTTWLWGGLGSAAGVLIVFVVAFSAFLEVYRLRTDYLPVVTILFVDFLWNFAFSPIGHMRQTMPIILAVLLCLTIRHRGMSGQPNKTRNRSEFRYPKNKLARGAY